MLRVRSGSIRRLFVEEAFHHCDQCGRKSGARAPVGRLTREAWKFLVTEHTMQDRIPINQEHPSSVIPVTRAFIRFDDRDALVLGQLLADGRRRRTDQEISMEDFAVAFVDELESADAVHTYLGTGY